MDAESKAYLDVMRQDLTQQIAESRHHAEQLNHEEDVRQQVQLVAEGVTTVRDQLGRIIADHEARITLLERRRMS